MDIKESIIDTIAETIVAEIRRELLEELSTAVSDLHGLSLNKSFYIHETTSGAKADMWKKFEELNDVGFEIPDWAAERFVGKTKQIIKKLLSEKE